MKNAIGRPIPDRASAAIHGTILLTRGFMNYLGLPLHCPTGIPHGPTR
jgi:hypothetical protein